MARFELISGPERRRRWSEDQKRALVAAAFAPGAVVAEVARRADVYPEQLYRWRQELGEAVAGFAEVVLTTTPRQMAPCAGLTIEIEFIGMASLRIPPATPPALARPWSRRCRGDDPDPLGGAGVDCHWPPDMRRGMNSLALQIQEALKHDPA
jgi:transposase